MPIIRLLLMLVLLILGSPLTTLAISTELNSTVTEKSQKNEQRRKRLKVGLVLSGGGARGFAHIGVIEWFEKNHIPIDYITGTSMGGLVGALYAMGMTTDEIKAFLKTVDWNLILKQGTTYENLSFRRKEDRLSFKTDFEFGLRKGVALPEGISSAHYIGLLFDRITLPYASMTDFDQLPIPYRCMATDFLAAKPVVLKNGSLTTAMRATMSIPGVFPPVERDNKVLVDGGLLNNIPTNVMKEEFNPDIVIAVDIGTPLGDMQAISSLFGILQQSITVMLIDNDRRNLRLADIVIAPELGNLSILDFSKIDQTIEIGYKSAQEKVAILDRFSVDDETWQQYVEGKAAKKQNSSTVADRVEVAGVSPTAQQALLKKVDIAIGEPLDTLQLEKSLTEIIGEGRYESLGYQLVPSSNDLTKQTLKIRVKEKSYAPPSINVGIEVEANEANDLNFTVGGRLTLYDIGKYGSELRTDLKLGFRTLVATEYYRPISKNRFLQIATRGFYSRETFPFFVSSRKLGEFQANIAGGGIDLAFLKTRSEVRVGYEIASLNVRQRSGVVPTPLLKDGTANSLRVKWAYDGQDSATISTKGTRISAEGRYYITTTERRSFPQVGLNFSHLKPINASSSLIINFIGSTSFNRDAGLLQQQTVGGPFKLTGFNRNEFRGNHTVIGSLGYLKQIGEISPLVGGRVFAIGMYEVGGAYRNFFAPKLNSSFAGGILVDTRIGPFSIIGGLGQGGRGQIYVSFGQSF